MFPATVIDGYLKNANFPTFVSSAQHYFGAIGDQGRHNAQAAQNAASGPFMQKCTSYSIVLLLTN
jgi:hypothetical protein